MLRIAVCDHEKAVVGHIKDLMMQWEEVGQCDTYFRLHDLLNCPEIFGGGYFDLIIIGMEWEDDNVRLDEALRICSPCSRTRIILMSEDFNRHIQQIFLKKADLFGFLMKPVEKDILYQYIRKAVNDECREDASLLIRSRGVVQSVRCSDILYMESAGHMVLVRTKQEDICCYGRLGKFLEQLPENFVQCHKSYLVNMKEIRRIEQKWIQMDQGTMIPISKSRSQNTKTRFFEYMKRMADA